MSPLLGFQIFSDKCSIIVMQLISFLVNGPTFLHCFQDRKLKISMNTFIALYQSVLNPVQSKISEASIFLWSILSFTLICAEMPNFHPGSIVTHLNYCHYLLGSLPVDTLDLFQSIFHLVARRARL